MALLNSGPSDRIVATYDVWLQNYGAVNFMHFFGKPCIYEHFKNDVCKLYAV